MSYAIKPAHCVAAGTPVATRSPLRWIPGWLRPGGSRLLGHRPRAAVTGRPGSVARKSIDRFHLSAGEGADVRRHVRSGTLSHLVEPRQHEGVIDIGWASRGRA